MEAEAEAVIFFIVEAEAEALEKSNASATLYFDHKFRSPKLGIVAF